jgi:hypothetical protein
MLPQIAQGDANKVWIVPSEIGKALEGIGGLFGAAGARAASPADPQIPAGPPVPPVPEPRPEAAARSGLSGAGPQLDPPAGRHAGLESWLPGGGRPVHDGAVGDREGRSVPGAGHAGGTPFDDDSSLV